MNKPLPLKIIVIISWLSLSASAFIVALSTTAAIVPPSEGFFGGFLRGGIDALGYDHAAFGAYEVGEVFGSTLFGVISPVILLLAVGTSRLWLLRTAAVLWILVAAGMGGMTLLPWIATILAFLPSVRRYCRRSMESKEGENEVAKIA